MKFSKLIIAALALLCASQVWAAPQAGTGYEPQMGKDYTLITPPQQTNSGKKIEVLEFFFYGCSHCFDLHPPLTAWEKNQPKDVELVYVPTMFSASAEPMTRAFYALESLGKRKNLDEALYKAWNISGIILTSADSTIDFVEKQGVDRKAFSDAYNSFSTDSKVMRSKQMLQVYGIRGTPTIIVDGKYRITGLHPGDTIRVLDALVKKARKERGGKA